MRHDNFIKLRIFLVSLALAFIMPQSLAQVYRSVYEDKTIRYVADVIQNPKEKKAVCTKLDLPETIGDKSTGGLKIGMSKKQVLESIWGHPKDINRTISARGTTEQWVYGDGAYLYFNNGRLTVIQD